MINDGYRISSNFRPPKQAVSCNVKEFYEQFEDFYIKVISRKTPDLPHTMCDPYGFALLCDDYTPEVDEDFNHWKNPTCKECFEGNYYTEYDSPYKHKFSFKILLDLLYRGYYFDYELAMNIYQIQKNPLHVFKQIMNGHGYIMNRLKPQKKKVGKLINYAYNSQISLDEDKFIPVPYKHRVCDGKTWPCFASPGYLSARIVKDETDGFGEGLFVITELDEIIDVLKINDLWVVDTPLENRLKFAVHSKNYPVTQYAKVFSWRSALKAGKMIGCDREKGILIRPCHEDYFKTTWFEWSDTSLLYCCKINGKLKISGRQSSKPDYYTLEGEKDDVPPQESRLYERIWLDDFDIKEFQKILELK